jgi:outer membrane protein assembly factor BamB
LPSSPLLASASAFGRHARRRSLIALVAVAALFVVLITAPARAITASITLSRTLGPPTTRVKVKGQGFGHGEAVVVEFEGTKVAKASASSTGSFSVTFKVPVSALPGSHRVKAKGTSSGRSASARFLVRTDWPRFHSSNANTGFNRYENVIGPSNVANVNLVWAGDTGGDIGDSSPAVAKGMVYVGSGEGTKLYAFGANGTTGCSGAPRTCAPLWTGATGDYVSSSPAVANGVVYVGSGDHNLYAFSAKGTTGCSGAPKTCQPLWGYGATGGPIDDSPAVAKGVVYIGSEDDKLYAYSANGTTRCFLTPKVCFPLWTGATGGAIGDSSPAVANGVVYVGASDGKLYAFSADGTTGCSGPVTDRTCTPLWTGATANSGVSLTSPAVAKGVVFVGSTDDNLYAFSANGTTGCSGTPKICLPLWGYGATGGRIFSSPAVANGVVYVGSEDGKLYAFSADGTTRCFLTPKVCFPLWTGATGGIIGVSSPAVANGVVYVGSFDKKLYAFSAGGTTGCSGPVTDRTCSPLWTGTTGALIDSSPAVANGVVYVGSGDGKLYAFHK